MAKKKSSLAGLPTPVTKKVSSTLTATPISEYKSKFTMDLDSGTVIPRTSSQASAEVPGLQVRKLENGLAEVYIPALATGLNINYWNPDQQNLMNDPFTQSLYHYTRRTRRDGKMDMDQAIFWWMHDPILFKSIRFLCQLANSRIKFSSTSEDAKKLVEFWFKQAMPHSFRKGWFLEYYRSGMVPVIKTLIPYVPREYKPDKIPQPDDAGNVDDQTVNPVERVKAVAELTEEVVKKNEKNFADYREAVREVEQARANFENKLCSEERLAKYEQALSLQQYKWLQGQIAGSYTLLNPMCVDIEGPEELSWLREPYMYIGGDLATAINNPTPLQAAMISRLPVEIVSQIKAGKTKIWLSPNICHITYGDKQDYDRYPTPLAKHCFLALQMKAELYQMDRQTVHSVKNRILLIKVGNDTYPVTDDNVLKRVAQVFNAMGRTGHFVWSHAIEMEWVEPANTLLNDSKKYTQWNDEIRSVTGVNPIFTGTSETSNSIGNSLMNFKGVEEEVGEAQDAFLEFLRKEIKLLRAALSISADVEVNFDKLNMKDEVAFMGVMMQMVMNGLLEPETALENMGFHFPEVKQRFEKILKDRQKGLFLPLPPGTNLGPDGKPIPQGNEKVDPKTGKAMPGTIDTKRLKQEQQAKQAAKTPAGGQSKPGGKGGVSTGGRPKGQIGPKNQQKKGKSQPKKSVTLTLKAVGSEVYGIVSESLSEEELLDTVTLFDVAPDHILTTAEWDERFPGEDTIQAWPELGSIEVMQASAGALKMIRDVEVNYDAEVQQWKKENAGEGKRGPYITDEVRERCRTLATIKAHYDYLEQQTGLKAPPDHLGEAWDKHLEASKAVIQGQIQGMADEHLDAQAWAMCTARFKKTM
jgi:hypothetical protein